jgi:hypothetical protein
VEGHDKYDSGVGGQDMAEIVTVGRDVAKRCTARKATTLSDEVCQMTL